MKNKRYNELKGKEVLRQVSINEAQAKLLNKNSKATGVSYELVKGKAKAEPKTEKAKAEPKTEK